MPSGRTIDFFGNPGSTCGMSSVDGHRAGTSWRPRPQAGGTVCACPPSRHPERTSCCGGGMRQTYPSFGISIHLEICRAIRPRGNVDGDIALAPTRSLSVNGSSRPPGSWAAMRMRPHSEQSWGRSLGTSQNQSRPIGRNAPHHRDLTPNQAQTQHSCHQMQSSGQAG